MKKPVDISRGDPARGGLAEESRPSIRQHLAMSEQLRYVFEFLSSDSFMDEAGTVEVSSSDDELQRRLAEVDYRIKVISVLLSMQKQERKTLAGILQSRGIEVELQE